MSAQSLWPDNGEALALVDVVDALPSLDFVRCLEPIVAMELIIAIWARCTTKARLRTKESK